MRHKVKFNGKVLQVLESTGITSIRLATNGNYDDVVYAAFESSILSQRILEDDKITIYGVADGLYSYEVTSRAEITLPLILAEKS